MLTALSNTTAGDHRRSIRQLTSASPVSDSTLVSLVEQALTTVPSAFNSQTTRIVLLLGADHKKLWQITGDALLAKIGKERFESGTKARIEGFAAGHGTIMFFDCHEVAKQLNANSPDIYKDKTDEWVKQTAGMHQYYLWVALSSLGFGVNLQHYNPIIDAEVAKTWGIADSWQLKAQMTFGVPKQGTNEPAERVQKYSVESRMKVFGLEGGETKI